MTFRRRVRDHYEVPLNSPRDQEIIREFYCGPNAKKLSVLIYDFHSTVSRFDSCLYSSSLVFTGKMIRKTLIELAGPDAEFVWTFMFKNGVIRKVAFRGYGKTDRILSEKTIYGMHLPSLHNTLKKFRHGEFAKETAYIERLKDVK